jgi:hypothetical protein
MRWPLTSWFAFAGPGFILAATFVAGAVNVAGGCVANPLDVAPPLVNIESRSFLEALATIGQENSICFGISVSASRPATSQVTWTRSATIRRLLTPTLANSPPYSLQTIDKVVRISPSGKSEKSWLETRIPRFRSTRAAIGEVSNLLYMELEIAERPELAKQGFAGHFRPGDVKDLIGPFDEQNRTVRELLDLIIRASRGGIWVACQEEKHSVDLGSERWLILTYGEPLQMNLERMQAAEERIRTLFAEKPK